MSLVGRDPCPAADALVGLTELVACTSSRDLAKPGDIAHKRASQTDDGYAVFFV
jgi:hypothetical protein